MDAIQNLLVARPTGNHVNRPQMVKEGRSSRPQKIVWLVNAGGAEAESRRRILIDHGLTIVDGPWGSADIARKKAALPAAAIVDLSRTPSTGRDIAIAMRSHRALLNVPFIIAGGTPGNVARLRSFLPDAYWAGWDALDDVLRRALSSPPPTGARRLSVFAAYAEKPLADKLGIKLNTAIALVDAPFGFENMLGSLPDGATVTRKAHGARDLTLWFTSTATKMESKMAAMKKFAAGGALWIIWSKTNGADQGLNQQMVRKAALDAGMVDFRICRIDDEWAGLRFTLRRAAT
jgi:hypothetical protein